MLYCHHAFLEIASFGALLEVVYATAAKKGVYSGGAGPILPIDDAQFDSGAIIILSGPFAGETIVRDPQTGSLFYQGFILKPKDT